MKPGHDPELPIERLKAVSVLDGGKTVGLMAQTPGNPPIILSFNAAMLEQAVPHILSAIRDAKTKVAGTKAEQSAEAKLTGARVAVTESGEVILTLEMAGNAQFSVSMTQANAADLSMALAECAGAGAKAGHKLQ